MATERVTLKDVYEAISRLEDKFDGRFEKLEDRTMILESFTANLRGKIVAFMFFVNIALVLTIEALKDHLKIRI